MDDLLRQRAEAVLTHDEQLFRAGIDPEAGEVFRDAQLRLFRDLTTLPFTSFGYTRSGDQVRVSYALSGVDQQPVTRAETYRFTRHAGLWFLADHRAAQPWDLAPIRVDRAAHGLVISHPGHEALAARVLAELDPAVQAVTEVWGPEWARQVAVLIPGTPDELRRLVGPAFTDLAGIAIADRADPPTGQRVVVNPDQANPLSQLELRVLLRHEFTHVAARATPAPLWLQEGFADYVGFRGSGLSLRQAAPLLTADVTGPPAEFTGPGRDLAYQQAYSICLYLAEQRGEAGLLAAYRRSEVDTVDFDVAGWRDFLVRRIG